MSEVESWLDSIDLVELYKYFEEDGWNTLESVLLMTNEDILAITSKRGEIATLTNEIENLRADLENSYSKPDTGKQQARKRSSSVAKNPNQIANKKGANKRSSSVPPEDKRSLREYGNEVLAKFGIKPGRVSLIISSLIEGGGCVVMVSIAIQISYRADYHRFESRC